MRRLLRRYGRSGALRYGVTRASWAWRYALPGRDARVDGVRNLGGGAGLGRARVGFRHVRRNACAPRAWRQCAVRRNARNATNDAPTAKPSVTPASSSASKECGWPMIARIQSTPYVTGLAATRTAIHGASP